MNTKNFFILALFLSLSLLSPRLTAQLSSSAESPSFWKNPLTEPIEPENRDIANFSISHGHCQLPMEARLSKANVRYTSRELEGLKVDFDVDVNSLVAAKQVEGEWTEKMKRPASFDAGQYPTMRFVCESGFKLGTDWFQLNGILTIKGKGLPVSFRARPIYDHKTCGRPLTSLVLDGQVNLKEYDVWEGNVGGDDQLDRTMFINVVVSAVGC